MKTAVTEDAPAASERNDRDVSSRFLPDDPKYRLTGEMSADDLEIAGTQTADDGERIPEVIRAEREEDLKRDREQQRKSGKTGAPAAPPEAGQDPATSGAQDDDTAAASEAASTQRGKTQAQSESRWAKLSRENRELREKLKTESDPRQVHELIDRWEPLKSVA